VGCQFLCSGWVDEPALGHVGGIFNHEVDLLAFLLRKLSEHVLSRILIPRRPTNSHFQSPEVAAEVGLERPDPIVTTGSTTVLKAKAAEGEVDVIVQNQQIPK
jgi:hypothetical protein